MIGESSCFGFSLISTEGLSGHRAEPVKRLTLYVVTSKPILAGNFTKNPVTKHLKYAPFPKLLNADQVSENGIFITNYYSKMVEKFNLLESALTAFHDELR